MSDISKAKGFSLRTLTQEPDIQCVVWQALKSGFWFKDSLCTAILIEKSKMTSLVYQTFGELSSPLPQNPT